MKPLILLVATACISCSGPKDTTDSQPASDTVMTPESTSATTVTSIESTATPEAENTDSPQYDFQEFVGLFESSPAEKIPDLAVASFLSPDNGDMPVSYYPKEILDRDPLYVVVYTLFQPVGPGVEEVHAAAFDKQGARQGDLLLGSNYPSSGPDGGGESCDYAYLPGRKIIKTVRTAIGWDETKQEEVSTETTSYYLIKGGGFIEQAGREYPQVSDHELTADELNSFSKDQLVIMRNEIFASHGYIFKNEDLKKYFAAKIWYEPLYDKVDEQLTDIERTNVGVLLRAERNR